MFYQLIKSKYYNIQFYNYLQLFLNFNLPLFLNLHYLLYPGCVVYWLYCAALYLPLFLEYTGYIVLPCIYHLSLCRFVGHVATFPQLYYATKLPYVFHFFSTMLCRYINFSLQLSQLLFCLFLDYAKQLYCLFTFIFVTVL